MGKTWSAYGLIPESFDVRAILRRAGVPYSLSPGDLISSTMVTSGTMTNRIDQLVKAHVATQLSLVEGLSEKENRSLNQLLRKFLGSVGGQ